jgi:hypothetical protein
MEGEDSSLLCADEFRGNSGRQQLLILLMAFRLTPDRRTSVGADRLGIGMPASPMHAGRVQYPSGTSLAATVLPIARSRQLGT